MMRYLVFALCATVAWADIYMHNPRGSNNRLNENTAVRKTGNRMFDSQNNARGGYNVGETTVNDFAEESEQYRMQYIQSGTEGKSHLTFEWTNQHGCGGNDVTDPHKQNCNVVIQMMCQSGTDLPASGDLVGIRNGKTVEQQEYNNPGVDATKAEYVAQRASDVKDDRGLHESWDYHNDCANRKRNQNLFTADQELAGDEAIYTRQSPNQGNRNGYECNEERDYFPYWHPTPWIDIAVLTDMKEQLCKAAPAEDEFSYTKHSFNREPKHLCVEKFADGSTKPFSAHNNAADCTAAGGVFTAFNNAIYIDTSLTTEAACTAVEGRLWGKVYQPDKISRFEAITESCYVPPPDIDCQDAPWTRSNHLGNTKEGEASRYEFIIPFIPEDKQCVFRIRYNISTDDYDSWNTNSDSNGDNSPISNNPQVQVGETNENLQLAINTAQFGRTFQDRSHVEHLLTRDSQGIPDGLHIHNVNVRGKRGNIVQTFPAVEYDFIPNRIDIVSGAAIHFQWTGSNSHDNGGNGGDGQAGSAGEGTAGTDRHNLVEIQAADKNFPVPIEHFTMFKGVEVIKDYTSDVPVGDLSYVDIHLRMSSSGHYHCIRKDDAGCGTGTQSIEEHTALNNLLNNIGPSYRGMIVKFTTAGKFYYMCTRNNSFTNRSQKGTITVE